MRASLSVGVFFLTLAPAIAVAQNTIHLDSDDIFLTWQLAKPPPTSRMAMGGETTAPTRFCGFQIRGNHRSRANPRVEWDMNIDEINSDAGRVAGVTAGVFDVVGHQRKPRPPIVDLSFSIEGNTQAIPARIVGAPNADNGIKALLETDAANQLFSAFSDDRHLISIALKYADSSSDLLQLRGYHDWRRLGGGKNSMLNECLRGYTPHGPLRPMP
jgi:hypothetical protein